MNQTAPDHQLLGLHPHTIHVAVEGTVAFSALCCSCFVIYLAVFRTTNPAVKVYAHMLVMNASVDLVYSFVNLTAMPIFYIIGGCFFIATANPLAPRVQWLATLVCGLQGFLTYTSVVILPIQFVYRYSVMVNRPLTTLRLLGVFCLAAFLPFWVGALCFWTFHAADARYDRLFRGDPVLPEPRRLPLYAVGDTADWGMVVHFGNCVLITVLSYVVIACVYVKTNAKFREMEHQITEATKRVQKQMEHVIFIQAAFPVLVLFTPCMLLPVVAVFKIDFQYMGEMISMMMHSTPVFNSFSVVLCVPSYRRIVRRLLCTSPSAARVRTTTNTTSNSVLKAEHFSSTDLQYI